RIRREYRPREGFGRESVSQHGLGAGRHAPRALRARQCAHSMPATEQGGDERPAHIPGRAGDEDAASCHYFLRFLVRFFPVLAVPPRDAFASCAVLKTTTTLSTRKSSIFAAVASAARMRRMLFSCSTPGWTSMTCPFHVPSVVRSSADSDRGPRIRSAGS